MIDAWSGPSGAPAPQEFRPQPTNGNEALIESVRRVDRRLREATSNLLGSAGIRLKPGRMIVEQSLDVEGDLTATGSATFSGDTEIGGNARITGTLSLPAGIIDNDALASPVTGGVATTVTTTGWSVSTAMTTKATTTIAIPAGFTRAIVNAHASMYFQDSAANGAWVDVVIAGNAGTEMGGLANLSLGQAAFHTRDIAGLSGGSITLEARVRASAASSTNLTARFMQIGGSATFFR